MGRNKKNTPNRGGRRGNAPNSNSNRTQRKQKDDAFRMDLLSKADMQNVRFAAYYRAQKIVPEEEWESLLNALKAPLPTVFRVGGSRATAKSLNDTIKNIYVPTLSGTTFEGESVPPPEQIPWYPEGLAWQFNVPKKVLRKSAEFKKFHSWLVFETEVGNVSRQEAVSMLPPLFLDVEPHHMVIDMCAAPGSKTAQLLEALHASPNQSPPSIPQSTPTGLVIANDSDHKRTHLLIHQSARLPSPALMVTNLDASIYPIIKIPSTPNSNAGHENMGQLLFDRILCDVPCSGDGTMRKNVGIWKSWSVADGNGLHGLQLRILQRAMRMLRDSGRIVYSTCSMNPVENEAVIAAALKYNPEFELVDVSDRFPELKRRPGLTTWRPTHDRDIVSTFETYEEHLRTLSSGADLGFGKVESKMTEQHWPPSQEDAVTLGLSRCIRIYPHLQDTGAFFVAVLQKKDQGQTSVGDRTERKREAEEDVAIDAPEPKKARLGENEATGIGNEAMEIVVESENVNTSGVDTSDQTKALKKKKKASETGGVFKENPYTFLSPDDPILQSCIKRLNLTPGFPSSNVLVRNPEGDAVRSLYLTNDIVKTIVLHNDYNRLRLTACGTKVFAKQEAGKGIEAQFRVLGEGLPVVLPYIDPESIMTADVSALKTLTQASYPLCASFNGPFRADIESRPTGSHVIRILAGEWGDLTLTHDLVLPIWKSNVSVALMIDKKAKSALSLRLFGEDITTVGREFADQKTTKEKLETETGVVESPPDPDEGSE